MCSKATQQSSTSRRKVCCCLCLYRVGRSARVAMRIFHGPTCTDSNQSCYARFFLWLFSSHMTCSTCCCVSELAIVHLHQCIRAAVHVNNTGHFAFVGGCWNTHPCKCSRKSRGTCVCEELGVGCDCVSEKDSTTHSTPSTCLPSLSSPSLCWGDGEYNKRTVKYCGVHR